MKKSILLIVFISVSSISFGQMYEIGVSLGGSNYVGDIGRTAYLYPSKIAGATFFKYNLNPRIALRATYSYLPIKANDLNADTNFRRDRGLSFSNTINELAVGLEYNFYEYDISSEDKTWTPYILVELAGFNYRYIDAEPQPNQYTYKTKNSIAIPFGVGIKSKLIGSFAFSFETKISQLNFAGTGNDWYMYSGVSLIYTFGRPSCYAKGL